MNLVERFFRDLSQQAILPGSFGSVRRLVDAITQYLAQHTSTPSGTSGGLKEKRFWPRSNELESGPW